MKDRRDRILDVAIDLAEAGGYENVRQRDVAEKAGVALGTLYKSFRSKEDILSAALDRETEVLEQKLESKPVKGDTEQDRIANFFGSVTRGLCKKPKYARAVIRAMASGEPEVASNVAQYQGRMNRLVISTLRGVGALPEEEMKRNPPTQRETQLALLLQQIWFSTLVGWSAGLFGQGEIVEQVRNAATLLLRGFEAQR